MNTLPKSMSAKIAILMVLMTGLVLNASYSANLTSFLFVKKVQVPFTDLKSLYHETDFSVGSVSGSSWQAYVKNHAEESILGWFNLLESRIKTVNSVPEGIEQMMSDDNYVFVWSQDEVYYQVEDTCHLQSVKMKKRQATFFMRKGFPYKEIIDKQ